VAACNRLSSGLSRTILSNLKYILPRLQHSGFGRYLHPQHKIALVLPGEKVIEQHGTYATQVQTTRRARRKTYSNFFIRHSGAKIGESPEVGESGSPKAKKILVKESESRGSPERPKAKKILVKSFTNSDELKPIAMETQMTRLLSIHPHPTFALYQLFRILPQKFIIRLSDPACRQAGFPTSDYTHEPVPTKKTLEILAAHLRCGNCQWFVAVYPIFGAQYRQVRADTRTGLGHEYETGAGIGRQ